ncbi:hypothetical protein BC937DRAFT_92032 [Endogone sp. FLAS-F59071]|nr:hypothetical protein BC937DRAFT_92032 [Endogone sp. FLAS-F59071]|eukprot:RUS15758.1 hypothetical protein BC937DRAFT_92032 [Endogone sp. FLAS-F59071]
MEGPKLLSVKKINKVFPTEPAEECLHIIVNYLMSQVIPSHEYAVPQNSGKCCPVIIVANFGTIPVLAHNNDSKPSNRPAVRINERRSIQETATMCWEKWKPAFDKLMEKNTVLELYTITDHPCSEHINKSQIPTIDGGESPAFILHSLPSSPLEQGYVGQKTLAELTKMTEGKPWFMMIGTSGAGKTRSLYELFCRMYGVFFTFDTGVSSKNMGSRDLDQASGGTPLDWNQPVKNSEEALLRTRSVLAGRLFFLEMLLQTYPEKFTPKMWLFMQLLPERVGLEPLDFWVELSDGLRNSNTSNLQNYIVNTVRSIQLLTKQKRIPIAIDEAQVSIGMHACAFYSTVASHMKRSFFAILLRTATEIAGNDTCTILSGTGLQIDDIKRDSASSVGTSTVSDGFNKLNDMREFVERFLGPLTYDQAASIFDYLRGRRRFVVRFLECAMENARKHTSNNMDNAIQYWRDGAVKALIEQLAQCLPRIYKVRDLSQAVETAVINHHVFSEEKTIQDENAALAVEVGFAQLKKIDKGQTGVVVVAGLSEPLAVMAFFRHKRMEGEEKSLGRTIGQMILRVMGESAWDSPHLGNLFERYLVGPLSDLFHNRGKTKDGLFYHKLFPNDEEKNVIEKYLPDKIVIRNYHDFGLENLCGKGHLLTFLEDPKYAFFMPEKAAGPDIVFILEVEQPDYKSVMIPVFVQAKFAFDVDIDKAFKAISPYTFFDDQREPDWCKDRRAKVAECLDTIYRDAKDIGIASIGMLIMYPKAYSKRGCWYDDEKKMLIIVVDGLNAENFFDKSEITILDNLKSTKGKKRTGTTSEQQNPKKERTSQRSQHRSRSLIDCN